MKKLHPLRVLRQSWLIFWNHFGLNSLFIIAWLIFYLLFSFLLYSILPKSVTTKGYTFIHSLYSLHVLSDTDILTIPYTVSGFLLRSMLLLFIWILFAYFLYAYSNDLIRKNVDTFGSFFLKHFSFKKFMRFFLLFFILIVISFPLPIIYISLIKLGGFSYLLMFITTGFYFYFLSRISLAGYFIQDRNLDVFEAMAISWSSTRNYVSYIFSFQLIILAFSSAVAILYFYFWALLKEFLPWEVLTGNNWQYFVLVGMIILYMVFMSVIQFLGYFGLAIYYNNSVSRRNYWLEF